ncbi:hypothetical protein ACQCN2_02915 [Brevibacillus ginsengisoli]|uniref:hypothetical protein n=1 Tax=Brevibacillus ginsengisoli TaxID=363854 RepID=UPI003CF0AE28
MKWEQVVKWLGMICLVAGISRMGMTPCALIWGTDSPQELTFGFIACILMSVGTIATYMVQSKEAGVVGFISNLAIIIGNIVITCTLWSVFAFGGKMPDDPGVFVTISRMIMMVGTMLGSIVFAIVTYRANVFPRWVVVLQVLMMASFVLPEWFAFFWGLSYVGMGYVIWTGKVNQQSTIKTKEFYSA